MNARNAIGIGLLLTVSTAAAGWAAPSDVWLTTRAKMALLTTDGIRFTGVEVDAANGAVTLHGKVTTQAEKEKAALAVGTVGGVKRVNNHLQVVPDAFKRTARASDEAVRGSVQAALGADGSVAGVKVASVNNGVVLLGGKATVDESVRAIEIAWEVPGVVRVASEIETGEK
jgi:hyperosmotically inducible periplasmic protein